MATARKDITVYMRLPLDIHAEIKRRAEVRKMTAADLIKEMLTDVVVWKWLENTSQGLTNRRRKAV